MIMAACLGHPFRFGQMLFCLHGDFDTRMRTACINPKHRILRWQRCSLVLRPCSLQLQCYWPKLWAAGNLDHRFILFRSVLDGSHLPFWPFPQVSRSFVRAERVFIGNCMAFERSVDGPE